MIKKKMPWILVAVLVVVVAALSVTVFRLSNAARDQWKAPVYGEHETPEEVVKNEGGAISAPGYTELTVIADTDRQGFSLANPAENTCYMRISLALEDGTVLWRSRLTAPGEVTDEVVLEPTLPVGDHPAALVYECWSDEGEKNALNGASLELTLRAK